MVRVGSGANKANYQRTLLFFFFLNRRSLQKVERIPVRSAGFIQTCCSGFLVLRKLDAMEMIALMIMNIMADHVNDNALLIAFSLRPFA